MPKQIFFKLILIIALTTLCFGTKAQVFCAETESWLQQLDEVLLKRDEYIQQKQELIDQLLTRKSQLRKEEDIYFLNKQIYEECMTFDSELSMNVVVENLNMMRRTNQKSRLAEWQIKQSFVLASTGLFMEALQALEGINAAELPHDLQLEYYDQMQYLYSHLSMYSNNGNLKDAYQAMNKSYNDSIYSIIQPIDFEYEWHNGWRVMGTDEADEAIGKIKAMVDTLTYESREHAMMCYVLARLYEAQGNREMYVLYLTKSSIADIRAANQDIASLEELAIEMYNSAESEKSASSILALENDKMISRAYNYINVCLLATQKYNNRVRTVSISRVLVQILQAYQQRDAHQRDRLKSALWTVCTLLLLVIAGFLLAWRQNKRLHRSRKELARANGELKQNQEALAEANNQLVAANAQLKEAMAQQQETNQQLQEADLVKEEYIGQLFSICSNYITKLDDFRKNINRKAKVKLWDDVLQMTDRNTLVQDELKEFYHNFDAIFLNLYPDFVTQFNELLLPEERIEPRKGELLNTDLRIYALVRLGINDSVKIAEFLHCSPQTVYNNRLKIRSRTILPKEDFLRTVQHLGHPENFTEQKS